MTIRVTIMMMKMVIMAIAIMMIIMKTMAITFLPNFKDRRLWRRVASWALKV